MQLGAGSGTYGRENPSGGMPSIKSAEGRAGWTHTIYTNFPEPVTLRNILDAIAIDFAAC